MTPEFSQQILVNTQISVNMKIRQFGSEVSYTNRQTDRQMEGKTDGQMYITKPIVGFRNILNAPKTYDCSCSKQFDQNFQVTYVSCSCLQSTCDHENAIRESDYIYREATFLLVAGGDVCLQAGGATLHNRTNTETCLLISNIYNGLRF